MKLVASRSSFSSFSATRRIYWCLSSMEKSPPAAAFIACLDLSDLCQPRGHFSLLLSFFYFSCYLLTPSLLFFLACNTTAKIFCQISAFYSKKKSFFISILWVSILPVDSAERPTRLSAYLSKWKMAALIGAALRFISGDLLHLLVDSRRRITGVIFQRKRLFWGGKVVSELTVVQ